MAKAKDFFHILNKSRRVLFCHLHFIIILYTHTDTDHMALEAVVSTIFI